MTKRGRTILLRLGLIFTITGIIVLAVMGSHGRLPARVDLILGIVLIVVGLFMLTAAALTAHIGKSSR
jgi:uncharacterized membrane protein